MTPGRIHVNIFGYEYSLLSDDDESYVKEVAQYIDEKMREIDKNQSINSPTRVAVLAALNIADELFQERSYRERLTDQLNEESRKLSQDILAHLQE